MHRCGPQSSLLVNAEVDSMGGVVDSGVGVGIKPSPHRAEIAKTEADIRQEYDVREERRRELEFLEKGGNPLDFFGTTASLSVQSTSLTDQNAEQFLTSEAKGSFVQTASQHDDSVESCGRPGVPTAYEPNCADNLLLFDGENEILQDEKKPLHPSKRNRIAQSEPFGHMERTQNAKESEDSAIFRPYARRNRSRINRDAARSSSIDAVQNRSGHGSTLPVCGGSKDSKGSISEITNQKDKNLLPVPNQLSAISNGERNPKIKISDSPASMSLDGGPAVAEATDLKKINMFEGSLDVTDSRSLPNDHHKEFLHDSTQQDIIKIATGEIYIDKEREQPAQVSVERLPCEGADKLEPEACFSRPNGLEDSKGEKKNLLNDGQSRRAVIGTKELDSESFCTNSISLDVNNDNDVSAKLKNVDSNILPLGRTVELKVTPRVTCSEVINKKGDTDVADRNFALHDDKASTNGSVVKVDKEIHRVNSGLQNYSPKTEEAQKSDWALQESVGTLSEVIGDNPLRNDDKVRTVDGGVSEANENTVSDKSSVPTVDPQLVSGSLKFVDKAHEDSILEEARIIKAKRKRISELSVGYLPLENRWKSHWDFVLEEMAWLANDFAQERLWKMTAAAQICRRVAFTSRLRFEEQNQCHKLKRIAFTIADAVMQFWHSTEVLLTSEDPSVDRKDSKYDFFDDDEASEGKDTNKELEPQYPRKRTVHAIQRYALRFLKYNSPTLTHLQAEAPKTPDRKSDSGVMEVSWDDNLTEESLFYAVPLGAVEAYRKSIEFHILQREIAGSRVQEEVETSIYDPLGEFRYDNDGYDEDELETSTYDFPEAVQGCKSSKKSQKRRRNSISAHTSRSYEPGADPYGNYTNGSQQSMLVVKRATSNLNAGPIPTKRMRTASRHRVISPFGTGNIQTLAKIDASSGDTSPLKDDQSTLNGGSMIQKSIEIESVDNMERQLPYDGAETSMKPKKKKKGSMYLQGWQQDSNTHNEQRDHFKRRFESHHFDSNGTNGLYGQLNAKKPKITKQALDNKYDNINPITRSIPSPVASQMSNMSNPNKPKSNGGRDRGRKTKGSKASASQPESETSWSHFEDQALVVVVHDMGSNWELVSDAVNDTFHFTCPYRNPKECSERHKIVIERGGGDGVSSAEDSGSSQSFPSTLPGIPKGSARQLFERMREPMEGETLRFHFQNIIRIEKKQHYRRSQDSRQILPVHNSHVMSLSQVCPNNLNGGLLTPFDLCDVPASSTDAVPPGYQGSHSSGLPLSNQTVASVLPASGASSSLPGSSGMVLGGNMASPSSPLDTSVRDGRYAVPRGSFPADEQHKLQQYSQIVSRRNMQQSSMSVSGGDRGVRTVPGGNGMGMTGGLSRGIPISRPGFQGMTSSAMVNSGAIPSSNMVGMPNPGSAHSGAGSGQGNSMQRPRDMHMIRPGRNPEHQRQLMVQELQKQGTQGNNQGNPAYSGMSSAFSNQTITPPVQSYPAHLQQHHQINPQRSHVSNSSQHPHNQRPGLATGPQQRPYPIHLPKERQRYMQHQQQFVASGALMPQVQPQPQPPHPGPSSLHNSSQTHLQTSPQSVSLPPLTGSAPVTPISLQHQQKHSIPPHGLNRNSQSSVTRLPNQSEKQRPRQQLPLFQQSGRHHPHQRQQTLSQQQAKHLKGMGRGNMSGPQNLSVEPLHLNGLSVTQGNQAGEKGDQIMHLVQGQGASSESDMNPVEQARPLFPPQSSNHSQPQRKVFSGGTSSSSKQLQKIPSHADNSAQAQLPLKPSGHTQSPTHQSVLSSHQHLQSELHRKQVNQTQHTKRILQQSHQGNSDPLSKCQSDQTPSELHPVNTASQMGTTAATAFHQACIDSDKIVAAGSSAVASQQKVMEPVIDSSLPRLSPKVGSIGSPSIMNSARSDSESFVSQGIGQRQTSGGGLPSHGHSVGAQQQEQHEVQQTHEVPEQQLPLQDLQQSPQQLQSPKQSHQHIQHLQASPGSVLLGTSNSKAE